MTNLKLYVKPARARRRLSLRPLFVPILDPREPVNRGQPDESRPSAAFSVLCPGAVPPLLEYPPTALWELSRKWDECQRLPRGGSRGVASVAALTKETRRFLCSFQRRPVFAEHAWEETNLFAQCKDLHNGKTYFRASFVFLFNQRESKNVSRRRINLAIKSFHFAKIGSRWLSEIMIRCLRRWTGILYHAKKNINACVFFR